MSLLNGSLAIVTGASSGIGRAACNLFAKEGAKVIAADINFKAAEETVFNLSGSNHKPIELDVRNSKSIENAFETIKKTYPSPPTIVVNSAGITKDNFLLNLTESDFDDVIDVNLKGTFLVTKFAAKSMIDAGVSKNSSIINLASIIGKVGNKGQSNYAASKAGVEAFTKSAAKEFGDYGIRVNAILPGFIETPMVQTVPDKVKQIFIKQISLKRMGTPEEVAELILFLASNKSSYINGSSIEITGGF